MNVDQFLATVSAAATVAAPVFWWLVRIEHRLTKMETIMEERKQGATRAAAA